MCFYIIAKLNSPHFTSFNPPVPPTCLHDRALPYSIDSIYMYVCHQTGKNFLPFVVFKQSASYHFSHYIVCMFMKLLDLPIIKAQTQMNCTFCGRGSPQWHNIVFGNPVMHITYMYTCTFTFHIVTDMCSNSIIIIIM